MRRNSRLALFIRKEKFGKFAVYNYKNPTTCADFYLFFDFFVNIYKNNL